jgi:guanylate kinase
MIDQNAFIEHAQFGSNHYGTSVQAVKDVAEKNRTCILDIEMEVCILPSHSPSPNSCLTVPSQGVKQVKKKDLNARYLSLQPPSLEILESRLRGRATDSEDAITQRLTQAKNELAFAKTPGVFDKVIINDDLEKAWKEFKAFCVSEE